ncbi:sigma-70 family RNA polymerase sigma factor [Gemmata sp. JC673]|uniref:Sigma-70 family RNA polymerase sigma factor n=1 Tax=Gemmata algarum TaxID=2975278 RepID=A0ABU5F8I7_9BACT|nr:sigma-70 family RNA polymerase sigma factor [Gemmata algarum]MDY3563112.1 sigma-70 family RNA polymerase sigma factor [Gemmata algarum]
MPGSVLNAVARLTAPDPRTDAGLVRAFLTGSDEGAFAELVRRHGPTVLGVCRRALGATPDAEDAFQATFLVLVRRARSTEWRDALGPWLYGVALKVAHKARAVRARRRTHERPEQPMTEPATPASEPDDAAAVLDDELAALPARYRAPLVLCEIRGASRRDAARELGLTEGTLSSRLARGRKLLRERLARRGVAPAAGGLAVAVPAGLAGATVRHATHALARAAGAVPIAILSLTEEVTKTMIAKWKLALAAVATCAALTGFEAWNTSAHPAPVSDVSAAATRADEKKSAPPAKQPAPERAKAEDGAERIATIFGDVAVTREQFTEHLIRRYGQKELEGFVNRQIVAHVFRSSGLTLKKSDVTAELEAEIAALGLTRATFVAEVLPKFGKSLEQWGEDVVEPRLMMSQLLKRRMPAVTEAELRQAFEARHGERLDCRVICWGKDKDKEMLRVVASIREGWSTFETCARNQATPHLAASGGCVPAFPRKPDPDASPVSVAAAKLEPGELSPLVETDTGFVLVKCVGVIPADRTKSFEKEKPALLAEVASKRLERELPKLFTEYKREAAPKYHLTFPEREPLPKSDPAKK